MTDPHPQQGPGRRVHPQPQLMARYLVGCAGQFALGHGLHAATNDVDEAFARCESGPMGCEVYDVLTGRWLGPSCWEEIAHAKARLAVTQLRRTLADLGGGEHALAGEYVLAPLRAALYRAMGVERALRSPSHSITRFPLSLDRVRPRDLTKGDGDGPVEL